ncbi:XRE family transcriptional regulator [Chryseobacterium joostei]|jgi:transcriptional regulator with XRE-family HTH domain|uniref:DNA-binding transcriptional regulator, XRE-family HTH domain n=1 Tax=Chryseobacterium joostei TaxID=112234 RepID=A0A1N7KJY9_9FLAO|nr:MULTISPECIES: helix-turn-helix transcriptional regulator [Chryseobacterium]AZA77805.1 XRE family transcriptional regulator [Chryseobacterium sp. G0186]AZA99999.1 XRE family transcriptional regulator [Chryseobacterium joostei]SIS61826.1 DNA-binding transcriptional regulator, XRE-family HTH domain [Chryseobacterium joostei]
MNIGQVIKDFRKQKGIKQGEFAELCKVSQTYLSLIENNQKEPNLSLLKTIAEQLEIPLPILFFLSLDENDVPEQKKDIFKILEPSLKGLIAQIYIDDPKS